jgi:hypothetical protein
VVEAGGPKPVAQLLIESFVLAEDDAGEHRPALARRHRLERARDASPQLVRDRAEPAPAPHDAEAASPEDHVDPLASEVRRLVEASLALGASRAGDRDDDLQERALRRRALRREIEARALVELLLAEAQDANGNADGELATPRGAGHLDACNRGPADLVLEHAGVEGVEAHASPPQSCEHESEDEESDACRRDDDGEQSGRTGGEREPGVGLAAEEGKREARAERGGQKVRRRHLPKAVGRHDPVTGPRAAEAARAGPGRSQGRRRAPRSSRTRRWRCESR